jgi:hypothetical protein
MGRVAASLNLSRADAQAIHGMEWWKDALAASIADRERRMSEAPGCGRFSRKPDGLVGGTLARIRVFRLRP